MPPPMPDTSADPTRNTLLRMLPGSERDRLASLLHPVELGFKQVLYEVDGPVEAVYFPISAVLSQVALLDGETVIEVNTIGPEGMAGLPVFLGAATSPTRVFCQIAGLALRLGAADLARFLATDGDLHRCLHLYVQASMVLIARNVACNRLHTIEQRTARWILMTHDRVASDTFLLTQEFLGQMLGVRRASVSLSAGTLQSAGLIRYTRGQVTVVDRSGLEQAACDCYGVIRREFDRLLG